MLSLIDTIRQVISPQQPVSTDAETLKEGEILEVNDEIKKIIKSNKRRTQIIINPPVKEGMTADQEWQLGATDPFKALASPKATPSLVYIAMSTIKKQMDVTEASDDDFETIDEAVTSETPEQAAEGKKWHVDNPVSHENIVNHYNMATNDEKMSGHSWYNDAHHMVKHIANDTKTPMHTTSGLIATYSPQTHWASNIQTAAKVARTKEPIGGPGSGVMASLAQKQSAGRMLNGEHYNDVLKGHKIRAFAHLIEHGDSTPHTEGSPSVVVDRHALSVAAGKRVPDRAFGHAGLKNKKRYNEVAGAYHQAAQELSKQHGVSIKPHQVQATTWLVRQRLNQGEDATNNARLKASDHAQRYIKQWDQYRDEHHPSMFMLHMPGVGYSKKEETAPEPSDHDHDWGKLTNPEHQAKVDAMEPHKHKFI